MKKLLNSELDLWLSFDTGKINVVKRQFYWRSASLAL